MYQILLECIKVTIFYANIFNIENVSNVQMRRSDHPKLIQGPINQYGQSLYEHTGIVVAGTGLAWDFTRFSVYILWFPD